MVGWLEGSKEAFGKICDFSIIFMAYALGNVVYCIKRQGLDRMEG